MTSPLDRTDSAAAGAANDVMDVLLRFGVLMLRAGNTAFGTREWMEVMSRKLGADAISVSLTLDGITASIRQSNKWTTMAREIGPPGVNAWRIGELEQVAKTAQPGVEPRTIAAKLAEIETTPPRYGDPQIAAAVGIACGAFAFLNGCGLPEITAAGIGGGAGQWSRSRLLRRQLNQHGVAALCAVIASGAYVLIAALLARTGWGFARHPGGFISSVLFLAPGFPLVAAQLDLLQYQTVAALSRLAYGAMLFLSATFGLSIIIAIAAVDLSPHASLEISYPLKLSLRAVASFVGGCGFAMLFNGSPRTVLVVGVLALAANEFRLGLHDAGMMLAPATFFGALAAGLIASFVGPRLDVPRIVLTVPSIIIMVPGVSAFEMIVFFNRGQMLEALQASAACGFVLGAMAMGLAAARLFSRR